MIKMTQHGSHQGPLADGNISPFMTIRVPHRAATKSSVEICWFPRVRAGSNEMEGDSGSGQADQSVMQAPTFACDSQMAKSH